MSDNFLQRIQIFQHTLQPKQVVVITKPADITYLTGFVTLVPEEREAYLCVSYNTCTVIYAAFSPITKLPGVEYHTQPTATKLVAILEKYVLSGKNDICIDKRTIFADEYLAVSAIKNAKIIPIDPTILWKQRMIKDSSEQAALYAAAALSSAAYKHVIDSITTGISERELAWKLESYIKERAGELAFPTIVAFGEHSSLPHHQPTNTKLQPETAVLFDFGAKIKNYCSDMSRTIWFGTHPDPEFLNIEKITQAAYTAALHVVTNAGTDTPISEIDDAARAVITDAGYGSAFIHTTGHGLGLEIHEQPSIYKHTTTPIVSGMAITIEPGIYLEKKFGYRHENTILCTDKQPVELTK